MKSSTEQILKIEEIEGLLDYKFSQTGIPFWVVTRWIIFCIIDGRIELPYVTLNKKKKENTCLQKAKNWIKEECKYTRLKIKNRITIRNKNILFFSTNRGKIVDGLYYENIYNPFIEVSKDKSTVLKPYSFSVEHRGEINYDICYREGFASYKDLQKINKIDDIPDKDKEEFDDYLELLASRGRIERDVLEYLRTVILRIYKQILLDEIIVRNISKMMKKLELVVLSEACYSYHSDVCFFFHKSNIPVLEIQHGHTVNHPCYQYSGVMNTDEYSAFQPDYFATWSKYWIAMCNMFPQIIEFGNVDIERGIDIVKNSCISEKKEILFCTCIEKEKNIAWLDQFVELSCKDVTLVVRPHPQHIFGPDLAERYKNIENIKMDNSSDIFEALMNKKAVLAEKSTVIYEARACGVEAYNIWNSYGDVSKQEGILVHSMEEFISKLEESGNRIDGNYYKEKYFGTDAKGKYLGFLQEKIHIKLN